MPRVSEPCSVSNCDRARRAKGLCSTHWKQVHHYGIEPREIRSWSKQEGGCAFDGCRADATKAGFCIVHYGQNRDGNMTLYAKRSRYIEGTCVIAGCIKDRTCAALLCRQHETLTKTYGLTSVQLELLWSRGCMICGSFEDLHIDHDHECCPGGKKRKCGACTRGCLCRNCNLGIGFLKDSLETLRRAIDYLSV